jgi:hypothetical protein
VSKPANLIRYDLFPAYVAAAPANLLDDPKTLTSLSTLEGVYRLDTARVVVTDTHILIAQDSPAGAQIVFNEPYEHFYQSAVRDDDSVVVTKSGKVLAFKKDNNCGCGSRLRSWNPYKTLYSTKG